jgi:hypothetical protein
MKCLDDIDALLRECIEFPYPALIKPLANLRAQIALDVLGERREAERWKLLAMADVGEPE